MKNSVKVLFVVFLSLVMVYSCKHKPDPDPACNTDIVIALDTLVNVSCGASDGSITVIASMGTAPYSYSLDGTSYQSSGYFADLAEGHYTVYVRDDEGCVSTWSDSISNNTPMTVGLTVEHATCASNNGSISVSVTGGIQPYEYSLDGVVYQSGVDFDSLGTGTHTVHVRDASLCVATKTTVITTSDMSLSLATTDAACSSTDGTITVTVTGGTAPYEYSLDGVNYQSSNLLDSLGVGGYTVRVRDSTGCVTIETTTVNDNGNVSFSVDTTSADCGLSNGQIQFHIQDGDSPFQFSINNGVDFFNDSLFTGLSAGNYNLVVKDNSGCSAATTIAVNTLTSTLDFNNVNVKPFCSNSDGSITVTGSGGAGSYQYNIGGGSFGAGNVFGTLAAGNHVIGVKDANGCEVTKTVSLTANITSYATDVAPLMISRNCTGCHGGYSSYAGVFADRLKIKDRINRASTAGGFMPKNQAAWNPADLDKINCWIDGGAPNN